MRSRHAQRDGLAANRVLEVEGDLCFDVGAAARLLRCAGTPTAAAEEAAEDVTDTAGCAGATCPGVTEQVAEVEVEAAGSAGAAARTTGHPEAAAAEQ